MKKIILFFTALIMSFVIHLMIVSAASSECAESLTAYASNGSLIHSMSLDNDSVNDHCYWIYQDGSGPYSIASALYWLTQSDIDSITVRDSMPIPDSAAEHWFFIVNRYNYYFSEIYVGPSGDPYGTYEWVTGHEDPPYYGDTIIVETGNSNTLTLSEGPANPQDLSIHPDGEPFTVSHIKLSLDESAIDDAVISKMSFTFSENGNPDYIHHVELHRDQDCDGVSDTALQSSSLADEDINFEGLYETISQGTDVCYLLKYVFDYEHSSQETGILSTEEDCEDTKYGASISPDDITASTGADQVEVTGSSVAGQVIPQVLYIVTHNASEYIESGKFVEQATSEVLGAWVGVEVCSGQSVFLEELGTDEKFYIYIEDGTSLYIASEYSNHLGLTLNYCNGTEDMQSIDQVNQLLDFYSDGEYIFLAIGDQISSTYENCCLKFAGEIWLEIVGNNKGWSDFNEDVLNPLKQSSYWLEDDVTLVWFKNFQAYNFYYAMVKINTSYCNAKASELLQENPAITFDGRKIEVVYE